MNILLPGSVWLTRVSLLAVVGSAILGCGAAANKPAGSTPLSGRLTVLVRPPDRNMEPVSVEEPGSLPVVTGGAMCLDARLDEPAHLFVVWLNSAGQVVPLYPWNNEQLEVTDILQPPPDRRATKLVFSPLLGHSWTFGETPGVETVLLLARRTPLPKEVNIGQLLGTLPPAQLPTSPDALVIVTYDRATKSATSIPTKDQPPPTAKSDASAPLQELLARLGEHFELVQAVQFRHQATPAEAR